MDSSETVTATTNGEKPKRTRKTHQKVRTGCQTCKIRRKKCDETKPFCRRCVSTGRQCDGYATNIPTKPRIQTVTVVVEQKPPSPSPDSAIDVSSLVATPYHRSSTGSTRSSSPSSNHYLETLWRPPSTPLFSTPEDFYCFDFFRHRTGPEFAAYFDSSIWRSFILRACYLYPTVLQAATAVGAVHRRWELGISRQAFDFCGVAARQHKKTIACLKRDLHSGLSRESAEVNMITSLLLSVFETFQGNYEEALNQFTEGLKTLLKRQMRTTRSETSYKIVNVGYKSLHELTDKLESVAPTYFESPTNILSQPGVDEMLPIPRIFDNLEHARDVIITEGQYIWDAWTQLELGHLHEFDTQRTHIARLLEWSMAYAEYSKTPTCRVLPQHNRAAHLLKAYREALYLCLLTQIAFHDPDGSLIIPPCDPPETCTYHAACVDFTQRKKALNAHLSRILVLTEDLLDTDSYWGYEQHSLSVDSGIGPPLYLHGKKMRSTKVRHQVTGFLNGSPIQKKLWDSLGIYTIAEKASSIEEHAVLAAGAMPRVVDCKWCDITFFLEEGRVLMRWCREDEYGGLVWSRSWVECG
jgi:cholestenol Delta-isomerase